MAKKNRNLIRQAINYKNTTECIFFQTLCNFFSISVSGKNQLIGGHIFFENCMPLHDVNQIIKHLQNQTKGINI